MDIKDQVIEFKRIRVVEGHLRRDKSRRSVAFLLLGCVEVIMETVGPGTGLQNIGCT